MRRFLSWVTLFVTMFIVGIVINLCTYANWWLIDQWLVLDGAIKIIVFILGVSVVIGLAFMPPIYGTAVSIALSEQVYPTRRGVRYFILGGYLAIYGIVAVILPDHNLAGILYVISGGIMILTGVGHARENS